jgi:hypothetical protein
MRAASPTGMTSPVRKWVKRSAKPVQAFTSVRRSVMRTLGMKLQSREESARAWPCSSRLIGEMVRPSVAMAASGS